MQIKPPLSKKNKLPRILILTLCLVSVKFTMASVVSYTKNANRRFGEPATFVLQTLTKQLQSKRELL